MKLEYFIAKRIIAAKTYKSSISSPIIKIGITAIALGVIMMLVSVATGTGLKIKVRDKIAAFNGHVLISNYDNNLSEVSLNPISSICDFYPEFTAVEEVTHIQAVAKKAGIVRTADTFEGINFKGVDSLYDWKYFNEFLVSGRVPEISVEVNAEVMISEYLANRLGLSLEDRMNTYFLKDDTNKNPNLRVFKIVGIYNSGFQEFDSNIVMGDIRHIRRMNKWKTDEIGNFEVFIEDFSDIERVGNLIYENSYIDIKDSGSYTSLDVKTIDKKYHNAFEWLKMFDFNIAAIITLMIIVAGINMITALLVLILERTQMIGLLKAMGSTNASVRKIFLYNAGYLIIRGLVIGNIIGIGLLLIQKYFKIVTLEPKTYYVSEAPVNFDIWHILFVNVGTFILCFLMLLIPSFVISKISPVKAIRFD
ncbi:MAG: ABC transporter permease [Flavobacteriaceae bacterium]|nr:ABC transporter permease [Flavobacteriaceae bacterium]